jgi:tetratricopeptide (TPR) repeat protein
VKSPQQNFDEAMRLHEAGRLAEAAKLYEEVVRAEPRHAHAWHQMGCIAIRNSKMDAAAECFIRSIQSSGGMATSHNNLGECFRARGELDKALASFKQAARLDPDYVAPRVNTCFTLLAQGHRAEAVRVAEEAMAMARRSAEEHCVAASLRLLLGDLPEGWDEHERRLELPGRVRAKPAGSKWDGRPLAGQSILLYAEQGLGDTLQFVRYVPLVEKRGGLAVLAVHKRAIPLLRESGFSQVIPNEDPLPSCDFHCALLSLGWAFGSTLESIPAQVPYLRANPELVARWKQRMGQIGGFRVGINWQGNPVYTFDQSRSIPLAQFAPLARVDGVRLVSLQKEQGLEQLAEQAEQFELVDLGEDLDVSAGPFMDTAAVIQALDLVITSDTSIAHLAGALGVPTWVVLPILPDWRWLLDREDSPWYPTMRLFRQSRFGDWNEVFDRVAAELAREVVKRRSRTA